MGLTFSQGEGSMNPWITSKAVWELLSPGEEDHSDFKGDDSPESKLREPEHKMHKIPTQQTARQGGQHRAQERGCGGVGPGRHRECPDPHWHAHHQRQTLRKASPLGTSKLTVGLEETLATRRLPRGDEQDIPQVLRSQSTAKGQCPHTQTPED